MTYVDSTTNKIKSILEKVKREKYFSYFDLDEKAKKFWQSWIDALRSGEFHQGKCSLKTPMSANSKDYEYCCLGVAGELLVKNKSTKWVSVSRRNDLFALENGSPGVLPNSLLITSYRLPSGGSLLSALLVTLNDRGCPFIAIADVLESVVEDANLNTANIETWLKNNNDKDGLDKFSSELYKLG